jgi:NUMOD3 motif
MWKETATEKWYVGSRTGKGCHPDDGYICSSKTVKPLIKANPKEWIRTILYVGDPFKAVEIESFVLTEMRAKQSEMSYNLHNQDMKWTRLGCKDTPEVLLKKSKARSGDKNPSFGKRGELSPNWGRKLPPKSAEARAKLSAALKGKPSWNKGKKMPPCTDERRAKLSAALKGKPSHRKGKPFPVVIETNKKRVGEKRPAQSLAMLGRTWTHIEKTCPHCGIIGAGGNMLRYHFDNCKHKGNEHGIT